MSGLVLRSLPDQLVELVRERILSGAVEPGRPVRQDALAAELGISKIPLREAMARLEQEGLLVSEANRGYFVRPLSREEAEEVYALRLKLEPDLAALAALRATPEERSAAGALLDQLDGATGTHDVRAGRLNRAYHLALLRPAGQPVTLAILERLHVLSERYVRKHLEPLGRDERANEEHRALLAAWTRQDGEAVAALTRAHIAQTLEDLGRQLGAGPSIRSLDKLGRYSG